MLNVVACKPIPVVVLRDIQEFDSSQSIPHPDARFQFIVTGLNVDEPVTGAPMTVTVPSQSEIVLIFSEGVALLRHLTIGRRNRPKVS